MAEFNDRRPELKTAQAKSWDSLLPWSNGRTQQPAGHPPLPLRGKPVTIKNPESTPEHQITSKMFFNDRHYPLDSQKWKCSCGAATGRSPIREDRASKLIQQHLRGEELGYPHTEQPV